MKKTVLISLTILSLISLSAGCLYAQGNPTPVVTKPSFPIVNWVSNNISDVVTIGNGGGAPLEIQITVIGNENSPGIKVNNCGSTTEIKAGSSTICTTNDASKPVNFSSDSTSQALGTYQIQQQ